MLAELSALEISRRLGTVPDVANQPERVRNAKHSKKRTADSSSRGKCSDDEDWTVSDGRGGTIMREEPSNTHKTRASMTEGLLAWLPKCLTLDLK